MIRRPHGQWRRRRLIGAVAVLLAAACAPVLAAPTETRPATAEIVAHAKITPWKPIFVDVEMCSASEDKPRPLAVYAVRIDLRKPTVEFLVTPSNGDEPKDCGARTTSEFLAEFKCQVAVNGSFFNPFAGPKGFPQDVVGLSLSRGDRYSPPNKWDALLISKGPKRRAWIDVSPVEPDKAYNGLSGHRALLMDGRLVVDPKDKSNITVNQHPRTAAGITRDGRYLILAVIDGRQPGYSEGTTLVETGHWMAKLGAHDALNLDGGGSTALVIEGPDGKPRTLNRPSGKYERRVANHLGVFAKRLPAK